MNFFLVGTKVFAFLFLIFANSSVINAQSDSIYRLPAGTKLFLKMDTEINSKVASVNDTFTAQVAKPVTVRESIVIPIGIVIEGRIISATRAATGGQNGKMEIRFETIRFENNQKREIEGVLTSELKEGSTQTRNVLAVLGGTAIGAIFGAVSKAGNGTLIGAGIGAGAGTGVAFLRKGRNVRIKTGEEFEIELKKDVTLPVQDY